MKRATQHSGRSHRTNPQGEKKAYSDFHLDRNFTTQADNIDKTRIDLSIENNIKNLTGELVADIVNNGYRPFAFTLNSDISEQQ